MNIFQNVKSPKKRYNNFNLSREVLLTGQIGKLIPVQCDEVVPGDRFRQSVGFLMRFAPLSAPAMARFNVHFHTFYVPNRIITVENSAESTWEKFIKSNGKDSSEVPVLPSFITSQALTPLLFAKEPNNINFTINDCKVGSLWDYLGLPTREAPRTNDDIFGFTRSISALPFFAYQKIYNDFYRRDQITPEIQFPINVGLIDLYAYPNSQFEYNSDDVDETWNWNELFKLRSRNYERDYFTSALPTPQFGDDVIVGDGRISWIGGTANINGTAQFTNAQLFGQYTFGSNQSAAFTNLEGQTYMPLLPSVDNPQTSKQRLHTNNIQINAQMGSALAEHFTANSFTINELRLAIQLQGVREKINRGGTRYLEIMQSIYGVTVPDARIQRPVYLGGCKNPVTIGAVVQTSESQITPQGTLTGKMQAAGGSNLFSMGYEFKEHGFLMTIMSVTPRTSYYGGLPRKFSKIYPEQFYLPDYDHLGEQEILCKELFFDTRNDDVNSPEADDGNALFGYNPMYSELKSALSSVHGEFRTTMDNWHVSRDFDEKPSLNTAFIQIENEDISRIFEFENIENTSNEHFYAQIYLDVRAKRNMSKYSTPWTLY